MRQTSVAAIPCGVLCSCPWNARSRIGVAVFCQAALVSFGRACVACVTAAPARRAAATIAASTISASVAPALRALPLWISMQYGVGQRNLPAGPGHAPQLRDGDAGSRGEHHAEHAHDEIEPVISEWQCLGVA